MSKVLGFFDVAYVINLDHRPDRMENVTREMQKVGIDFVRVPGVEYVGDGKDLPDAPGYETPDKKCRALGCSLGHRRAVQMAKASGASNCLIFEDDVTFIQGFAKEASAALRELRWVDWELFYFYSDPHLVPPLSVGITEHLRILPGTCCCHAYALNKRAIDYFLGEFNPPYNGMIVDYFTKSAPLVKVATKVNLAFQASGFSDIKHEYVVNSPGKPHVCVKTKEEYEALIKA